MGDCAWLSLTIETDDDVRQALTPGVPRIARRRRLAALERPHPLRVAVDGIDAAGKTTLADELAPQVQALGRPVIRASLDGTGSATFRPNAAI